jgi:hypothetical protein
MAYIDTNDWENVVKEEARVIDDADLGEVQEVLRDKLDTKSGVVDKETYTIPRNLVEKFDGHKQLFRITKGEANSLQGQGIMI